MTTVKLELTPILVKIVTMIQVPEELDAALGVPSPAFYRVTIVDEVLHVPNAIHVNVTDEESSEGNVCAAASFEPGLFDTRVTFGDGGPRTLDQLFRGGESSVSC